MLDTPSLYEVLLRLHYPDLINICRSRSYLYKITCTPHFQDEWKKYNIRTTIANPTHTAEVDRLGLNHGNRVERYRDGSIAGVYPYVQAALHGNSVQYFKDGRILRKTFVNGTENGCRTHEDPDGVYSYENYSNGQCHGLWRFYAEDWIRWRENEYGQISGKVILWNGNGGFSYIETYKQGKKIGKQIYWYPNGQKKKEMITDIHGDSYSNYCEWYENGNKKIEYRITCTPHFQEEWKKYNIHIEITSEIWPSLAEKTVLITYHKEVDRLGLEHGKSIGYFPDGTIAYDHSFVQGIKHGTFIEHVEEGHSVVTTFTNGIQHGPSIVYFEDGGIRYSTYVNGERQGLCRDEQADGSTWTTYRNNNCNGLVCKWDIDGKIRLMGFSNGITYSKCYRYQYHPNGKLKNSILSEYGILVKTLEYDDTGKMI